MVAGRPRTSSYPKEKMIELGEEMIKWIDLNKPLHVNQFYSVHKGILWKDWEDMIKLPEFRKYYEQALSMVSINYINGNVSSSVANRFTNVYFKDVKRQDMQDMREKAELELEMFKKKSDHEAANKAKENDPPFKDNVNLENKIIEQAAIIEQLKEQINAYNKSKAE